MNYNGMYDQQLSIIISSDKHEVCLYVAKKIKNLCDAWSFEVTYTEHKSAPKGIVLKREIMTRQIAYAGSIIAFREAVRCLCFHFNLYNASVVIHDHGSIPKDARTNLTQ
jgi:hypothetical protein